MPSNPNYLDVHSSAGRDHNCVVVGVRSEFLLGVYCDNHGQRSQYWCQIRQDVRNRDQIYTATGVIRQCRHDHYVYCSFGFDPIHADRNLSFCHQVGATQEETKHESKTFEQ